MLKAKVRIPGSLSKGIAESLGPAGKQKTFSWDALAMAEHSHRLVACAAHPWFKNGFLSHENLSWLLQSDTS